MKPTPSERTLFVEAFALATTEARQAYLDVACGDDRAMRQRIEALLDAEKQAGGFLEVSAHDLLAPGPTDHPAGTSGTNEDRSTPEQPGDWIGRYRLLERIGEGGWGSVYLAEQENPVRRRVALKILKPGMDTPPVVARFEAERQALALMDHPHIARILDGGATPAGRPYLVMELVRGIPVTEYCDESRLPTADRLRLFIQICHAIEHAHQKGVIHRDLKPSNILVTINDGVPVPKIIDFGIAKATGQRLTDKTLFTRFHAFIGTPAYTSPEQAGMSSVDIDTRSDIYSLGVLLYELLIGRPPFDGDSLLQVDFDEMRRVIRDVEPARPSTRLGLLSPDEATTAGSRRRTSPPDLTSVIRGDLDWITMKCLEKDRARRYETASALAADLERHLNHEPIHARPTSTLDRLLRWRRRHPTIALLSASLFLVLALVATGSIMAAWRISTAREAEREQRTQAEIANRELAKANANLADTVGLLELQRASDALRDHDASAGLAQLAAILRRDPSHPIAANRLVSAMLHRNWAMPALPPIRHALSVATASFSANSQRIVSASWDETARVHDAATGETLVSVRHAGPVLSARFNPAGTSFATASADGTARIWNATNGQPLSPPLAHLARVFHAEFSPDGTLLLTASAENFGRIWDVASGRLLHTLPAHSTPLTAAGFNIDGQYVITASAEGIIHIAASQSGRLLHGTHAHFRHIHAITFNPRGNSFATSGEDGRVHLRELPGGRQFAPPLVHPDAARQAAFSPDGRWLVTASQDGSARIWDATNGATTGRRLNHEGGVISTAFSPDGRLIASAGMDNAARVWFTRSGTAYCQPLRQAEAILHTAFSPDGRRLLTASQDHSVQVWNIQPRRYLGTPLGSERNAIAIAVDPRGRSVATASAIVGPSPRYTAGLWNPDSGQALTPPLIHPASIRSLRFSPDGESLVTSCADGLARVWNTRTGQMQEPTLKHDRTIWFAEFSPQGDRLVTASEDGTARLWHASTRHSAAPPIQHEAPVNMAAFSPDGRLVATASDNHSARVWDGHTGKPVSGRLAHHDNVEWVAFSPDSRLLVSASSDNTAQVWDVATGQPVGAPMQHARTVTKAIFSPDGQQVATISLDRAARIWDARNGTAITPRMVHQKPASQVSFSPDGTRLLTSDWEGLWRLWDPATGRPLTEWLEGGGPGETSWFTASGDRVVTGSVTGPARVWECPPAPTPVPTWFLRLAEGLAGQRLGATGDAEPVPRSELGAAADIPPIRSASGFYGGISHWHLAPPDQRGSSPFRSAPVAASPSPTNDANARRP